VCSPPLPAPSTPISPQRAGGAVQRDGNISRGSSSSEWRRFRGESRGKERYIGVRAPDALDGGS
jgi:hypothetical protein